MSLWDRFTKKPASREDQSTGRADSPSSSPPPAPGAEPIPAAHFPLGTPHEGAEVDRLRRTGEPDGPTAGEALTIFRGMRASAEEARAIDAVCAAAASRAIPEPLRIAVAAALAERGEPHRALALVSMPGAPCTSPEARLLTADLHAERGEIPEALAMIERVLVLDLDYPGARERHARWRMALGLDPNAGPRPDASAAGAATLVSREPDAPFVLLREVARGGSGAVYEAEDRELARRVALKVYHHPERDRAQLLHEARVAAALAGAGVVRVLDVDPEHGWLALEWAALGSLRQHLRRRDHGALEPVAAGLGWALPLAAAIARVHSAGWVHQDIKPANVLLAAPDRPLLADFGTARRAGEPSLPGSLGYVSPERLAGRPSDPRDDVFGFGRILEDALAALAHPPGSASWSAIAAACTGPDAGRPSDARALVTRLRVEASAPQSSER